MNQSALLTYDNLPQISKTDRPWKLKARVIALWHVPEHMLPLSPSSMDMVLIDNEGVKFEASVSKSHPFRPKIVEGRVYQIAFFRIIDNIGTKRYTSNEYRLLFHSCTRMYPAVDDNIPQNGWDFFHMDHINYYGNTFGYLVDVIGLLTAASSEKFLIKDKRIYKTMDIELLDQSGMTRCVLVGDIVDMISEYLCSDWIVRPVVGLCFVEVRQNNENISIHAVPHVTKILINHKFEEDWVLADRFDGINSKVHVEYIPQLDVKVDVHADMLDLHPKKTIPQLLESKEKGVFVVHAWIVGLLKDSKWFYPSCRCYTELEHGDDIYRCNRCFRTIAKFMHRYSFKLEVYDGLDSTVFVLNDREAMELINIPCEELMNPKEATHSTDYPPQVEDKLVGKELLFKIRSGIGRTYNRQEIYEVVRICDDAETINMFMADKLFTTPLKAKFVPPFTQLDDVHDNSKFEEKHVGKLKYKNAVAVKCNVGKKSSAVVGQSSNTTVFNHSLKRKLQAEFDTFVSEISDDLEAIEAVLEKSVNERYGGKTKTESSGMKIVDSFLKKSEVAVAINNSAHVNKATTNLAEDKKADIDQKLKSTEIIDLTHDDEEFEISPTQIGTMTQSLEVSDFTKMEKNGEVTSKEVIDLTNGLDEVQVTSNENAEDMEVWEVVDLSA